MSTLFQQNFQQLPSNLLEGTLFVKISPPSVCFHSFIKDLPLPLHSKPFMKKSSLEEMKGINDNASAFMHLSIKLNKQWQKITS